MKQKKKTFIIVLLIAITIGIFSQCVQSTAAADPRGKTYAGASSCRQCHQAVYDSFIHTAHFNSTALVTRKNMQEHLTAAQHVFSYKDGTNMGIDLREDGYYQVSYKDGKELEAHKMEVVFGGHNALTFLYNDHNFLYELPLSFYQNAGAWATSPGKGFNAGAPYFKRAVGIDCFDCHSAAMQTKMNMTSSSITEEVIPGTIVYGIDCERCHGPAQAHVDYHVENPQDKIAKYIVTNSALTVSQRSDACGLCHSGNSRAKAKTRFEFKPGDTLANMYIPYASNNNSTEFDVHGNQSLLLADSRCASGSTITCATCHDPHTNASNDLAFYSQKCMSCHKETDHNFCPKAAQLGEAIKANCIDCHMPQKPSAAITFQLSETAEKSAYMLRTHRIAVYDGAGGGKKN